MTLKFDVDAHDFGEMPAAIIFDLDNTLYDYSIPHDRALHEIEIKLFRELNIKGSIFRDGFNAARKKVKDRLGNTASSHSRILYFQQMLEDFGLRTQPLLALDLEQTYWRSFLGAAKLFPGALNLLMELSASSIRLGIVTDLTANIQFRKLVHFGIDRYFEFVVTSEEAGKDKVGLAPFEIAEQKLATGPRLPLWVIGDDLSDMRGAKEVLNALTMQKLTPGSSTHPADAWFSDYDSLLKFVRCLPDKSAGTP